MSQNPHCPVSGCSSQHAHTDDPMVNVMMQLPNQELTKLYRRHSSR